MARGGARAGAGRKPNTPGVVKVQMTLTINPDTREKIRALAERHSISMGEVVDNLLNEKV